ncbi:dephospho-CoA kinase [Gordonia soli NBRC 108243]|uniref:Dephospho-CoA kinase n=1 Tax=Gordonia soli NBRC 108243 TaxID=1223545 RepID=M0QND5_9ACTN|nr:dephospho-CoA kinase [Gordonia soli NBRC 108243]
MSGGIGAGKSTVAKAFAERGGHLVDADRIAREVVEPGTPGLAALVEAFGESILADDGSLDRPALAAKAFADEESRQTLNSITHPLVGARTQELVEAAPDDAIVIQDIPLLVEGNLAPLFHLVVIVHADERVRLERLTSLRGMDANDARARIAAQASVEQRRAVADVWLDNSGDPQTLEGAAAQLWTDRLVPFERNVRERRPAAVPLELTDPDPEWGAIADRLVARLWVLAGDRAVAIDHVGSTAVPDLLAKPVIDIQITVADLEDTASLSEALTVGGFPQVTSIDRDNAKPEPAIGGTDETRWRKRFHASADPGRPANIHIRAAGSPGQAFALDFRDWLRSDPSARAEYAEVKRTALAASDGDPDRYVEAKEPWFDAAHRRVADWKASTT